MGSIDVSSGPAPLEAASAARSRLSEKMTSLSQRIAGVEPPQAQSDPSPAEPLQASDPPEPEGLTEELEGQPQEALEQDETGEDPTEEIADDELPIIQGDELSELKLKMPDGQELSGQDLVRDYMGRQQHTQVTQRLAERNREQEALFAQLLVLPDALEQQAAPQMAQYKQMGFDQMSAMDVANLARDNPQMFEAYQRYDMDRREIESLRSVIQRVSQQATQLAAQQAQKRVYDTDQYMHKHREEWSTDYVREEFFPGLAREYRMTPHQLMDIMSPEIASMAMDALEYRKLSKDAKRVAKGNLPKGPAKTLQSQRRAGAEQTAAAREQKRINQAKRSDNRTERHSAARASLRGKLSRFAQQR